MINDLTMAQKRTSGSKNSSKKNGSSLKSPMFAMLREKSKLYDCEIQTRDMKLHCHQSVLANWSPVFDELFSSREVEFAKIDMKSRLSMEVRAWLQCIYPPNKKVKENTVKDILDLAYEYQMQTIVDQCEAFLLKKPVTLDTFFLSYKYDLHRLQDLCSNFSNQYSLQEIESNRHYRQMSSGNKANLLTEKLKILEFEHMCAEEFEDVLRQKVEEIQEIYQQILAAWLMSGDNAGRTRKDVMHRAYEALQILKSDDTENLHPFTCPQEEIPEEEEANDENEGGEKHSEEAQNSPDEIKNKQDESDNDGNDKNTSTSKDSDNGKVDKNDVNEEETDSEVKENGTKDQHVIEHKPIAKSKEEKTTKEKEKHVKKETRKSETNEKAKKTNKQTEPEEKHKEKKMEKETEATEHPAKEKEKKKEKESKPEEEAASNEAKSDIESVHDMKFEKDVTGVSLNKDNDGQDSRGSKSEDDNASDKDTSKQDGKRSPSNKEKEMSLKDTKDDTSNSDNPQENQQAKPGKNNDKKIPPKAEKDPGGNKTPRKNEAKNGTTPKEKNANKSQEKGPKPSKASRIYSSKK